MPPEVLGRQALNRALLARQQLLDRAPLTGADRAGQVIGLVEHLAGLQAQAPFPPYFGLLARLEGFRPEDLSGLLVSRQVVRIALMRGDNRKRLFRLLNVFPGSVLIDGFVAGMWRRTQSRTAATLTVELFGDRVPARDRDAVAAEAERVLAFAAPAADTRQVRFGPLG